MRRINNLLGLAVLAILQEKPAHPYEIDRTLRERKKEKSIKLNYGSLYMVIEQLAKAGFIAAHRTERDGQRPERTVYELTGAGHQEMQTWMAELLGTWRKEFRELEAGLALLYVLAPAEGTALLEKRRQQIEEELNSMRAEMDAARGQGVERLFLIEGEYRYALANAEREFLQTLLADLKKKDSELVRAWRKHHRIAVKHA